MKLSRVLKYISSSDMVFNFVTECIFIAGSDAKAFAKQKNEKNKIIANSIFITYSSPLVAQ